MWDTWRKLQVPDLRPAQLHQCYHVESETAHRKFLSLSLLLFSIPLSFSINLPLKNLWFKNINNYIFLSWHAAPLLAKSFVKHLTKQCWQLYLDVISVLSVAVVRVSPHFPPLCITLCSHGSHQWQPFLSAFPPLLFLHCNIICLVNFKGEQSLAKNL